MVLTYYRPFSLLGQIPQFLLGAGSVEKQKLYLAVAWTSGFMKAGAFQFKWLVVSHKGFSAFEQVLVTVCVLLLNFNLSTSSGDFAMEEFQTTSHSEE